MSSNNSEDRFDWDRAEADVSEGADVVDLDAERARRDGADEGTARIAAAGQRRADRAAAADGLTKASAADAESLTPDQVQVGVPVDPPEPPVDVLGSLEGDPARPILPRWVTNRQTRRDIVRRAARAAAYQVGTHAAYSPLYAGKVALYTPRGGYRAVARVLTWASAEAGNFQLRQAAATRGDAKTFLDLDKHRMRQSTWRWTVTGIGAAATIGAGVLLYSDLLPWWVRLPVLVGGVLGLARLGRPAGKPILERTIVRPAYRRLTADLTRKGIMATGLVKRPEDIEFRSGDIRADGPGYLAVVDLPDGVIATDVINKREQLAGGLRLPMDQVWPETIRGEHPSRMALWVADKPVSSMKQPAWPHLNRGTTDYFSEFVYGFDPRMRPVMYRMDERNSLFAGMPGSGKSLSARVVLAAMALDPLVTFAVFDLAGRGDFDMFEPLCAPALFGSGADDDTKERAYRMIMWLLKECETRGPLIKHYATKEGLNSENKLNRAIAQRDPRLRPIVASIDEVQELITDPDLGKAVQAALTSIIKRGRALGIHLMLETQRIDAQSLPKGVTSNIALRTCLSVPSHTEVELALGTGTYNQGARPNHFEIGVDAGWGVRVGYGPMKSVRAAYLDRGTVEAICKRGVKLRGGPVADVDLPPARDLLADLMAVWVAGEAGQHYATLAGRLTERYPDAYGALNEEALSAMVRALGLPSRQVKVKGTNLNGVRLADIQKAIGDREEQTD